MALSGKQRRDLRAKGHHLEPVVLVGQSGLTDPVVAAVAQALSDHELVKVKMAEGHDRHQTAEELAARAGAELAQVLGRTALLFKKRAEKSKFEYLAKLGEKPAS